MPSAAGMVLAAGGIAAANEAIFAPMVSGKDFATSLQNDTNLWRLIPATAILALTLGGVEKISAPLGKGFAGLVLMAVLIVRVGNSPTPIENISRIFMPKAVKQ
jgi:hypothetical protein